jgi:hypothetical protein
LGQAGRPLAVLYFQVFYFFTCIFRFFTFSGVTHPLNPPPCVFREGEIKKEGPVPLLDAPEFNPSLWGGKRGSIIASPFCKGRLRGI